MPFIAKVLPFQLLLLIGLLFCGTTLHAQESSAFWIEGQVRPRLEWRNGYKSLQADSAVSTAFVEQRSRLALGYKNDFITLFLQPQDVRVWGSTPLINNNNSFFTLFNGWVKLDWAQHWSLKVGRQVWSYDNQRILGGLNWAAQGRAHDGLLLQYKNDSSRLELQLGAAYNSTTNLASTYNIGGNYRTLQFLRFRKAFSIIDVRLLLLNIGQDRQGNGLDFELTAGGLVDLKTGKFKARLEGYYQFGNWLSNAPKQAFLLAAKFSYSPSKFRFSLGADWLSGTDEQQRGLMDNSFNPWLGTNHVFYGHLDYFYVGSSHQGVGLIDGYAEVFYTVSKTLKLGLMYHYFQAPNAFTEQTTGRLFSTAFLGHEIDFVGHFKPKKYLKLSFGYAQLLGNTPLETLKPSGSVRTINNWAWMMLDINLELFRYNKKATRKVQLENQRF
ncbi:MAG: alginate export family protein [Aureispira sp.]